MLEEEYVKLLSFQDIRSEVDQTELDAWQKLIRVLRHGIEIEVQATNKAEKVLSYIIILKFLLLINCGSSTGELIMASKYYLGIGVEI